MRTLLTGLLMAVAGLQAHAQTVDICDRTPEVRDAILEQLEADDCAAVEGLANVSRLDVEERGLTALRAVDFDGLTNLRELHLYGNELTALPAGVFDGLTNLRVLWLHRNRLTALPADVFDSLGSLELLGLSNNWLTDLPAGVFDRLASLERLWWTDNWMAPERQGWSPRRGPPPLMPGIFDGLINLEELYLNSNSLTALPVGVLDSLTTLKLLALAGNELTTLPVRAFDSLTNLQNLGLSSNQLTTLPAGVFDGLANLQLLQLQNNQLAALPAGLFDGLTSLVRLWMWENQLTTLPEGVFDGLINLREVYLNRNRLTTLPAGAFRGLTSLVVLPLEENGLTALPAGLFDGLANLDVLYLQDNRLTTLSPGVFDGLASLRRLNLGGNELTTLPEGVFDGLTRLQRLTLTDNRLTGLPPGVFDGLVNLVYLDLRRNHLVGLTRNDPLLAALSNAVDILVAGQTDAARLAGTVPLMLSAVDSTRQGFVRIVNESGESGIVRIFAFDDGGHSPDPIEVRLGAGQVVHFNSNDLEDGNAGKGIEAGIGIPVQGDWRLDVETALAVRVLAFIRYDDGFLTAMHDVLPRDGEGRLVAQTFNPGSNRDQESLLRLANTGAEAQSVSIAGVDDRGNNAGPVTLTLPAGQSRTLSAFELENGAQGLDGTLGDGTGKWRLFVTAGDSVVGASLLEAASGHLTNISTTGVANAERAVAAVPLMLSASSAGRMASCASSTNPGGQAASRPRIRRQRLLSRPDGVSVGPGPGGSLQLQRPRERERGQADRRRRPSGPRRLAAGRRDNLRGACAGLRPHGRRVPHRHARHAAERRQRAARGAHLQPRQQHEAREPATPCEHRGGSREREHRGR